MSIEESNLFSAESVTLAFNEVISSFKESANNAEVLGNNEVISVENIIPPRTITDTIIPNFINISL